MKKSLAIIMSLSLVATAAFAQDAAVAATATTAAKTVAAPVATYGFKADFEARVAKDAASNTYEQDAVGKPISKFNPLGLKATKFAINPFVNLDWSKMSVKAEAAYNAFDANLSDYSKIALTTTWKDFYGVEIKSEVTADNKGIKDATVAAPVGAVAATNVELGDISHNITATYDRTKENGIKLYSKYDAAVVFGLLNFGGNSVNSKTTGDNAKLIFDGFKELGFALDTADFGANLVYKQGQTLVDVNGNGTIEAGDIQANRFDTAWFEARKMFNVWTARFNDSAKMALRIKDLDSKVTIGRSSYGIGEYNNVLGGLKKDADLNDAFVDSDGVKVAAAADLVWLNDMNMLNTITPVKNLTVKAGVVLPTASDVTMVDWLKGENLNIGAEYAIDGIGTIGAGTLVSMDYVACDIMGMYQGPSKRLTNYGLAGYAAAITADIADNAGANLPADPTKPTDAEKATLIGANVVAFLNAINTSITADTSTDWDSAYWLDANLSKMLGEGNSLFVSLDGQAGNYIDQVATAKTQAANTGTKPYTLEMASMSKYSLGAEVGIKATEALKLSAAAMFKMGVGFDVKAATGTSFADKKALEVADTTQYVSSSYTEGNALAYEMYGIRPLQLNVRADYTVSKTASVYLSNGFKMNDGDLAKGELDAFTAGGTISNAIAPLSGARTMLGYYSKNTIGLGATLAATAKSKLTVSGDYNLYLGVPTESDLYLVGATDAQKKTVDAAYGTWKSSNFNPFSVKVAYSYAY